MAERKDKTRADAVRHAVEQAFQAADQALQAGQAQAQVPRERAQEVLDDLSQTAGRLRGALDDLRPASSEEVRALRATVQELERRLAKLESGPAGRPSTRKRSS